MSQRKKSKVLRYECAHCLERFEKSGEHRDHVMEKHDVSFAPKGQRRLRRPVTCWSCAVQELYPDENGEYRCECGFVLPNDWKKNWPGVTATDVRIQKP
jgi:hypothetical protein